MTSDQSSDFTLQTATPAYQSGDVQSRAEMFADGAVHAVGFLFSLAAGSALLALSAFHSNAAEFAALTFYVASLLMLFAFSGAYNLWPSTPVKWFLRRLDHASIYLLIAGTYTPFLTQLTGTASASALIAFIWVATIVGVGLKLFLPGRFDRLAVGFYLLIGWSGVLVFAELMDVLPASSVWLMLAGGIVYSLGVIFYAWRSLKYQTAVWHAFVVTGAGLHFAAVADALILARVA